LLSKAGRLGLTRTTYNLSIRQYGVYFKIYGEGYFLNTVLWFSIRLPAKTAAKLSALGFGTYKPLHSFIHSSLSVSSRDLSIGISILLTAMSPAPGTHINKYLLNK
jgi:hypothetical protein